MFRLKQKKVLLQKADLLLHINSGVSVRTKNMKAIGLLFISFFLYTTILGQETKGISDSVIKQNLKGTWYVNYSNLSFQNGSGVITLDSLVFKRHSNDPDNMGDRIEIYEDGKFVDAYAAGCGNDSGLHLDIGSWTLDSNETIIITTIPVFKNFGLNCKKHKIVRLTPEVLVLQKIE